MTTDLLLALDAAEALTLLADEVRRIRRAIQDAADRAPLDDKDSGDAFLFSSDLHDAEKTINLSAAGLYRIRQRAKLEVKP